MVIISQQLSLLVLAALAGLMFILITGGTKIQAENSAQTELRVANRAFLSDVDNASTIFVQDDTKMTLSSTNFLKDPTDATKYLCRSSSWYIAPASADVKKARNDNTLMSLHNDITIHKTASCASPASSTQARTAVTAIAQDATFLYKNIAGVPLNFSNGIVTNFQSIDANNDGTLSTAEINNFRTANNVDSWYTDDEAMRETPKVIDAKMTAVLPITENNVAEFKATTNDAETELVGNDTNVTDPGGEQTRWIPNAVSTPILARSTTTGPVVGGVHEGIQISWAPRPAAECAPTQKLTYSWILTNLRTKHVSSGQTTANNVTVQTSTGPAEVWNGGKYSASVAARCNDIDGQSPTTTVPSYTLPLPDVQIHNTTSNAAETSTVVSWDKASSDPTTKYTVTYTPAKVSNSYKLDKSATPDVYRYYSTANEPTANISGAPTSALTITHTKNKVTPGFPDIYYVRASTTDSPNTGGDRSAANYIYRSDETAHPNINAIDANNATWVGSACATGNTKLYRSDDSNTYGGKNTTVLTGSNGTGGATGTNRNYGTINQGSKVWVRVDQRCKTIYTDAPTNNQSAASLSPWGADETASYVRPISVPARPTNPTNVYVGHGNGSNAQTAWNAVACPTGTNISYGHRYARVNSNNGSFGATEITATRRTIAHNEGPGGFYVWAVFAKCSSSASGTNLHAQSGDASNSYYTDVPNPTRAPAITRSVASTPINTSGTVYASAGGCVANTVWSWNSNPAGTYSYSTNGTRTYYGTGHCLGANGRTSPGTSSDNTNITWYTPAPSTPGSAGGVYVMTCQNDGSRSGFSGTANWSASSYATSYTVTIYYKNRAGGTSSLSYTTSGTSESFGTGSSAGGPNATVSVTAHGPGGTSGTVSNSLTLIAGGCQ
jgi:hypothetical protein